MPPTHLLLGCLQELTFEVGPSAEAKKLKVALYEATPGEAGTDEFIGSGRWAGPQLLPCPPVLVGCILLPGTTMVNQAITAGLFCPAALLPLMTYTQPATLPLPWPSHTHPAPHTCPPQHEPGTPGGGAAAAPRAGARGQPSWRPPGRPLPGPSLVLHAQPGCGTAGLHFTWLGCAGTED